jgi:hypothetical protein
MANVKAISLHYKSDGAPSKTYYFIETLNILTQKTIEVEIDKSPGFNKQASKSQF